MSKDEWRKKPKFSRYKAYRTGHVWDEIEQMFIKERPLKKYMVVNMKDDDGKWHTGIKLHTLIAELFIENPNNLPEVNHKDEDGSNNCVDNLEWCTRKYNINYGTANKRRSEKLTNGVLSKPVAQYTIDGTLIKIWPSMREVERSTVSEKYPKGFGTIHISKCCRGKRKTAYGFIWRYA